MKAILITLLAGLSFLVGYIITKFVKNDKKLIIFSVGFSFTIIIGLICLDLLPECLELVKPKWSIIGFSASGLLILKILDAYVPDHEHTSPHSHHMEHIGLISAIALILHNLIEGTAIYSAALTDTKMGLMMALAVSFHNIPLGIQISSLVKNKKEKFILLLGLVLSSVIGVILLNVFKITLDSGVLGILISLTLGMLVYILVFELFCEIKENIKNKILWIGMVLGVVLIVASTFLG